MKPAAGSAFWQALYPGSMLLATGLVVATGETAIVVGAALVGLAAQTAEARQRWTSTGHLGWANALTWVRILASAVLLARTEPGLTQVLLAAAIFILDGADGAIARARGTTSEFGAQLDKECDAFYFLAVTLILWTTASTGLWVLIAGLWRYAYSLLLAFTPNAKPAPRSTLARYTYSTSSCLLMAALWPGNPVSAPLALLATGLISASFLRSLYYCFARN